MKAEVSLRKWDPSCRYRCENSPWRAAPGPGRPEAPRYSRQNGPRAASAFQRDALGQETTHWGRQFAYPNALLPTPIREGTPRCLPQCPLAYPNAGRHATLPTPMHRNLPQCGEALAVAYPNAARHSQLPTPIREGTRSCLPQCPLAYPNAGRHSQLPTPMRQDTRSCLPQWGKARNRPPGPPFHGGAGAHASFCS